MTERTGAPRLAELTWVEAADRLRRDPRLLLPVASLVQHGPHLPLSTDHLITTAVAEGIAARHDVLVSPTIPFGAASDVDRAYAGTAALAHKTLHRALNDLVGDWAAQGVRDLVLLTSNGLAAHYRALVSVMAGDVRIRAIDTNVVDTSPVLGRPATAERAGEIETALILYIAPRLVRIELVEDRPVPAAEIRRRLDGTEPVPLPGSNGVIGRPTSATAEKGKRVYDYLVRYIGDRLFGEPDA